MENNNNKNRLSHEQYRYVISALASHQPISLILQHLAEEGTSFSGKSIYTIKYRNKPQIAEAKAKNKEHTVLDEKYARILSRERIISKLEGSLAHAGNSAGVDRIAAQINNMLDSIAKELGHIQSGTRVSSEVHVHSGPEESWRGIDKALQDRRVKDG